MSRSPRLLLASSSPRRLALLRQIHLMPAMLPVDIDESVMADELPEDYVRRLALAKAQAGQARAGDAEAWVLAADTTVVAGGQILGKPTSFADAQRIWALLPAPDHCVYTAIAVMHGKYIEVEVVSTRVEFLPIPEADQIAYWDSDEPKDKAGAYAVQGRAAQYVKSLHGSYTNVVGLPLAETVALLRRANYPLWE
ncbi:MAG: nucleoside triphosphate pyrophosphatase [Paraperlucidibaca sp.]